jgi:Leu/Phe-tRNA-protein transferase
MFYFADAPVLSPDDPLAEKTRMIAHTYRDEFCVAESFSPAFIAALMYEGYLPMGFEYAEGRYVLTPKLHLRRSLLFFDDLHVTKTVRRRSRAFALTVDRCFEEILARCVDMHGCGWLVAPLCDAFRELDRVKGRFPVTMHSFELWRGDDLVAGEIGYATGACYTSLSGFTYIDSGGTVQLCCTAKVLKRSSFRFWDLGMPMEYKSDLNARTLDRSDFLINFHEARTRAVLPFLPVPASGRIGARSLLRDGE